jgi:uncharacterized membrane protein
MTWLILGLVLFIGTHSVRIVADDWRTRVRQSMGAGPYKGIYSVLTVLGFVLMVWGYGQARQDSALLWAAPIGMYHATATLMLISMVLLAGFHAKRSAISVKLRHPMLWSVVVLCVAHLMVNGRVADLVLFGSLGVWAVADLVSCYWRDVALGTTYPKPTTRATVINVVAGLVFYAVFAFWLHEPLIGVRPIFSA